MVFPMVLRKDRKTFFKAFKPSDWVGVVRPHDSTRLYRIAPLHSSEVSNGKVGTRGVPASDPGRWLGVEPQRGRIAEDIVHRRKGITENLQEIIIYIPGAAASPPYSTSQPSVRFVSKQRMSIERSQRSRKAQTGAAAQVQVCDTTSRKSVKAKR